VGTVDNSIDDASGIAGGRDGFLNWELWGCWIGNRGSNAAADSYAIHAGRSDIIATAYADLCAGLWPSSPRESAPGIVTMWGLSLTVSR
jgi:hypothetical protein